VAVAWVAIVAFIALPPVAAATVTGSSAISATGGTTLTDAITYSVTNNEQAVSLLVSFPPGTTVSAVNDVSGTGGQNNSNTTCAPHPMAANAVTCGFSSAPFLAGQTLTLSLTTAQTVGTGSPVDLYIADTMSMTWGPFHQTWA
jgi:hypothetical protein